MHPEITLLKPITFQRLLLAWFDRHGRKHLPWQQNKTPYAVWISEIMLQQTQVATVIPYFTRFMQSFPDCKALANADEEAVLHHWAGLGYYSRARNIHKAAKMILHTRKGRFPTDFTGLTQLPGIGPSTANAILSLAYDQPAAILDGNVKRVLARFCAIHAPIDLKTTENTLWQIAQHYMASKRTADYTQAIMDLGATLCTRHQPRCTECPLQSHCQAYHKNCVATLPIKKKARALPVRTATFLVFQKNTTVLLYKRPAPGIWGGLWSLPEIAAKPDEALLPINQRFSTLGAFRHTFTHYHLDMHPVLIKTHRFPTKIAKLASIAPYKWYDLNQPEALGIPQPIQKILQKLVAF